MTYISGWVGSDEVKAKYDELNKNLPSEGITVKQNTRYNRTQFYGKVEDPSKWTPETIALYVDGGNLCFGGMCEFNRDTGDFEGVIYTD